MQWQILSRDSDPAIRFGVQAVAAAIREETGFDAVFGSEQADRSRIWVGTDSLLPQDGYRIRVSEAENGIQTVRIEGADAVSAMYGCFDFVNVYLAQARISQTSCNPYFFRKLFGEEPLPAVDRVSVPSVRCRGIWSWGLSVYDYRGFLENMARLKLNEVIFWNDFAPVNGRDVVDYAHALGIRVIWGYAWGWDTALKLDVSEEAVARIADQYEREYADLGGDGIYFQSFTETTEETLGGRLIAEAVVDFVNRISARILERHPGLRLQFGLHASSVRNHLEHIRRVDPRVEIIWEDCGDFPYHYIPSRLDDPEGTRAFTEQMLDLRKDGVGAVLKGMICLDWGKFQHQSGAALLGCANAATADARLIEARKVWRYIQAEWMAHGDACRRTVAQLSRKRVALYGLVEDGMLEREIPLPVALFAGILWDCGRDYGELMRETALRTDVRMA